MKRFYPILITIFLLELLIIPFILRLYGIGVLIIPDEATRRHITLQIIAHDSIIYFLVIILIYFSYLQFIPKIISFFLRFFAVFTFILYIIDIFIVQNFVTHININDFSKYISYVPKYIHQEYTFNFLHFLIIIIVSFILFIFIKKQAIMSKSHHLIFGTFIVTFLSINSFSEDRYVHSWVYKNFIEYNIDLQEQSKEYSHNLKNNLKIYDNIKCINSISHKKNIIILMIESFASYQSNYFSGIRNWTPNLDKIAKSNISIKNFYSNGFITEDAEISILTGLFPIYSPNLKAGLGSTAFQSFYNVKKSLPQHLNSKQYQTEFITSADLDFSNTGDWANNLEFDYIEGSKHKFYKDKKKYHFDAVADEFLFKRVLNRINKNKTSKPYFMFVKTVSSHVPFINPENNIYSEKETIRYVDKEIGKFYKQLKDNGFFDNGLLIIVGDHHPIIPLKEEQILKYGQDEAGTHVPFILSFGDEKKKLLLNKFQQTDIYNSLKNYTSEEKCTSDWSGDFILDEPIQPKFIPYRRGDRRGTISVFNKDTIYNVKLNGDKTKVINQEKSEKTKIIVNKINYERIKRQRKESSN